jgi:hypothetical protein
MRCAGKCSDGLMIGFGRVCGIRDRVFTLFYATVASARRCSAVGVEGLQRRDSSDTKRLGFRTLLDRSPPRRGCLLGGCLVLSICRVLLPTLSHSHPHNHNTCSLPCWLEIYHGHEHNHDSHSHYHLMANSLPQSPLCHCRSHTTSHCHHSATVTHTQLPTVTTLPLSLTHNFPQSPLRHSHSHTTSHSHHSATVTHTQLPTVTTLPQSLTHNFDTLDLAG